MTQMTIIGSTPQEKDSRSNTADLDRVNLVQALRDFEIANARVLDLTQRLIESERRRKDVENELEQLRLKLNSAEQHPQTLSYRAARWAFHRARDVAKRVLSKG
ncbi:MAG TPA: hypothetical protein VF815_10120 [Myxococcaceae bacterium]|jgi:predicted  nucleic acid-binding Zn-ribbon protein